ncbi:unnamed protein product [Paramecium sonneborni]|uniref:Dynein heavy chain n=1 Tax=Paramecium sonneborni TaxID=65129 RepID=A0A8S1JTR7_9CILI|nr:unnamed protein product [Paramecium sonneborni]
MSGSPKLRKLNIGPLVKIKKQINLPKIRKQEESFQAILNVSDFDLSSERDRSFNNRSLRKLVHTTNLNLSTEKKISEEYAIYGLSKLKIERIQQPFQSERTIKHQYYFKQDEYTNKQWFELCLKQPPPHALGQFYKQSEKQYQWCDVQILDYNQETEKFLIQQYPKGPKKQADRLQIKFNNQNQQFFESMIQQEQLYQHEKQSELAYVSRIMAVDSKLVNQISDQLKQKLQIRFSKYKNQNLINNLITQVEDMYQQNMKKCVYLKDLTKYKQKFVPIPRMKVFYTSQSQLKKNLMFVNKAVIDCWLQMIKFMNNFKVNLFEFDKVLLPVTWDKFEQLIDSNMNRIEQQLKKQRFFIYAQIQENLQNTFNFFNITMPEYVASDLKSVVKRFDLHYTEYLYKLLRDEQQKIIRFYQKFQLIQQNIKLVATSLFQLKIVGMNKQKLEKFEQSRNSINDDLELITLDIPINAVINIATYPNRCLFNIISQLNKIESEIVPLLKIPQQYSIERENLAFFEVTKQETADLIEKEYSKCQQFCKKFLPYQYLLMPMKTKAINKIFGIEGKEKPSLNQIRLSIIREALDNLSKAQREINYNFIDNQIIGLFTLNSKEIKQILIQRAQENYQMIVQKLIEIIKHNVTNIKTYYQEMYAKTSTVPQTEEDLIELKLFLDEIKIQFSKQYLEITQIKKFINYLDEIFQEYDQLLMKEYYYLLQWPKEIKKSIKTNSRQIESIERQFFQKLEHDKEEFTEKLFSMKEQFTKIKGFNQFGIVKQQANEMKILADWIFQGQEQINSFNQRETMFQIPLSQYREFNQLMTDFKPFQYLWELANEYEFQKESWLYGSFKNLNHQQILQKLTYYVNETMILSNTFKEISDENGQSVTRGFRRALDAFKDNLWVVETLAIEAFTKKPVLWRELFKECRIQNFDPKEDFSLQSLIQRGILNVKEQVVQLSQKVEKGWNIEKRLNEMYDKLVIIEIELQEFRETFIQKNYEEVQTLLDEQLNVLSMLKSQQHIKMVLGKANQLEYKIVLIQDTLELGMKCQKHWMYLDPIFASEDIKRKLVEETEYFKMVDQSYRQQMGILNKNKILWDSIDNEKIKQEFQNNVQLLDSIQKSLSKYLEQKRTLFPRFYFVSDEELIEILALVKDPRLLQKHIFKCFEGMHELKFEGNHTLLGMMSSQQELVIFDNRIELFKGEKQGNVEQWLCELQRVMNLTLRTQLNKTLQDLNSQKQDYISKWPTQCILLADHIKWTRNTEIAIRELQKMNLHIHLDILTKQLQETVQLVRNEERLVMKTTLEAMVVMEVHCKDIVQQLIHQDVKSIYDFAWVSQLRYYFEDEGVNVRMVNAQIQYGFEYLGKVTRLVITSLTDRCQRTLLSAMHLNYGGAPEGPAGTGKSETVKDLAKAVAMPCIVFNCSDGLNYIAMGKFFKGLSSSGAWCCFDEFNRIDPEVLSVVAQQIFTIQKAIKEKRNRFTFEGEEINLIPTCAINVTMNPGYAGRSELPDNLKILFRPCAMMVPDYAMIAEIYLYSIGFEKARELSPKIVTCLKLCNEQLSPQEHYDFGMRVLKAVLSTAKQLNIGTEEVICLTALINVNKPKFTLSDIQLFLAITQDLFPSVNPLSQTSQILIDSCFESNYQPDIDFQEKCQQLNNTISVRNGVMCIGKTFSGKTAAISTLGKSLNAQTLKLNPKAVTTDQLYGKLDPDTKQWSDGILPILIRDNLTRPTKIWIWFDGPVDSLWIENLNTVLDDNKKLCLTSGEILKIPQTMCMLFEVEDLSAASPATISRCGMVYFLQIDWYLQVQSIQLPGDLDKQYFIRRMRFLLDHSYSWAKEYVQFPVYDTINLMVQSFVSLLVQLLKSLSLNQQNNNNWDSCLIFALVWSIGGCLEEKGRSLFNDFLHKLFRTNKSGFKTKFGDDLELKLYFPEKIEFFSCVFQDGQWIKWTDLTEKFEVQPGMQFHEIIIPTAELMRNDYFCKMGLHFLFCGPTSTGKSLSMNKFSKFQITCSGQTTSNSLQRLIETKINKRRRKGYYGAEEGHIIIFVDDLNMPFREPQGAQPAIELLRQWMDQGGWYDLENKEFKYMCDITFLSAMQPASGGRDQVSKRYLRYFNLLYIGGFDNQSISNILLVFVDWVFLKIQPSQDILKLRNDLVYHTIQVYDKIQLSLLPTPAKSLYIYNLRDLIKVFEGMSKVTRINNQYNLVKLWTHECLRVFSDRLIDSYDLKIFENVLKESTTQIGYQIQDYKNLIYVSFLLNVYDDAGNVLNVKQKLQQVLEEYNQMNQQHTLSLILFNNAVLHISRIARILLAVQGHALLVGMGGTGRTSLSKLANYIIFNEHVQMVDPRQWDDQLLGILKHIGLDDHKSTIIFNDSQFQTESMLEDVCNIMSHGEIPHLFPPEERIKIQEEMTYPKFVLNCKLNTHVILCMQPVGTQFRKRLRMFPTIINCSTIDWFMSWPDEALESTASQFLPQNLVKIAVDIHHKVLEIKERFTQELRRHFYVTPTQYLQLLATFKKIHTEKNENSRISIDKFETGVEKIIQTEKEVDKIRKVLFELQPKLEKATVENLELLKNIQKKQKEADQTRLICEYDEQQCSLKREEANQLKDICQKQLDNVLPLLSKATEALEKITKDDMILLKSFQKPPPSAAVVMQGLCYAFQEDEKVKGKNNGKEPAQMEDFWEYSKKYVLNDKLIKRIKKMKIEEIRAINPTKIQKLSVFIQNPLFERDKVFNASMAAGNLADWIRAVYSTYEAVEIIEPKKAQLVEAEKNLKLAEEQVEIKRQALAEAMLVLNVLSVEYQKARKEKEEIEKKVSQIQAQLNRAEKLTNGLGEEKQRWKKKVIAYKSEQSNADGDCLISAAIISYLGVFPIQYREQCLQFWKLKLKQNQVNFSDDYTLQVQLCDPIQINKWIQQKLPNDSFSIDNAIILKQSTRWPLMIDPQLQANEWIKNMEDIKVLLILNSTQPPQQVQLQLEHAIQIGYPVLLENLGQSIDPLYEPILQQKIIRKQNKCSIKFGEKLIEYSNDFRFYMTTKLNNPHFQPQVCVMVNMLMFQVTQEGLVDQLLNIVVKIDEPQKEEQRIKNIQSNFINKNKLIQTETLILKLLSESQGELLENEDLIQTLQKSKDESLSIEEKLKGLEYDRVNFNQIRQFYKPAAEKVASLYFILNDLAVIEHTYLWSLDFYFSLYTKSIREAQYEKSKRNQNIIEKFILTLYTQINRSLLEKDKLIFRFLLCVKMMNVPTDLIRTTVMGCTLASTDIQMPKGFTWLTNKMWLELVDLTIQFPQIFESICSEFVEQKHFWDSFYVSQTSYKMQYRDLDQYQINMLIKIIKPEQFIQATNEMIRKQIGNAFLENIPTTFEQFYLKSDCKIPLLCLITPGADPRQEIIKLASKYDCEDKFNQISLGQGQSQLAIKMILSAMSQGSWVLLQNCHLASSFMPDLEQLFETQYKKEINADFRLWLTSQPTSILPHNVILKSLKITYELPRGLKNNMLRSYQTLDADKFEQCKKLKEWKNLFFSLSLLHACLLERKKYGPLGWNIGYNFSQHDLEISKEQIVFFLDQYSEIPWDALHYLIAENNYGGRVTDPMDRKLLKIYVEDLVNQKTISQDYIFYDIYQIPPQMNLKGYNDYISQLPLNDPPQLFGLHANAEIYSAILETENLSSVILQLLPRTYGDQAQKHTDSLVCKKSSEILKNLPQQFNIEQIQQLFPLTQDNPLNAVIQQEITKYNKLLAKIQDSLSVLVQGLDGFINISDQSLEIYNSVFDNKIPESWLALSYLTTKSLGSWITDLKQRIEFLNLWITKGQPIVFWLGGLFFIQGFLTAILQQYSRKSKIPIDQLRFNFKFHQDEPTEIGYEVYTNGISIDGASFDFQDLTLAEPSSSMLFYPCPIIQFCPTQEIIKTHKYYSCPLYNTSQRKGVLTSNGLSVNFICKIKVPINNNKEHWSKRGVALIVQAN